MLERWEKIQAEQGNRAAAAMARTLREQFGDFPFPTSSVPEQRFEAPTRVAEQLVLRDSFTRIEKEVLRADGAEIYLPTGLTIPAQREAQIKKGKPSFWFVIDAGDRLLAVPSRKIEVAIYPAPERFFVPDSFKKNVQDQEKAVAEDAEELRKRTGLEGVTEIILDEASTLTEIVFQHLDRKGAWLFGAEYASAQSRDWVYGRTKTSTDKSGSGVASVGSAHPALGLDVSYWRRGTGNRDVGAPRVVVPIETR